MKRVKGNRGRKRVPTFTAAASLCLVDEWLSFSLASSSRSDPTSFSATSATRWAPPTWVWSVARSDWAVDHSERSTDSSSVAAVRLDWRHSLSEVTSLNSTLKLCREREREAEKQYYMYLVTAVQFACLIMLKYFAKQGKFCRWLKYYD